MSNKTLTIEDLLDAGLHFGHQTKRWNPKMKRFIHGAKGGIYIIDLQKTLVHLKMAQEFLNDTVMNGRKVLMVGTKKQARTIMQEAAEKAGQPYVIHRWLGGMLTNNATVRKSVQRMEFLQAFFGNEAELKNFSKKEQSMLRRELTKLERNLTGIKDMNSLPGAMVVVDINREKLAIAEAQRLNIPVVALVDTNTDPDLVDYPIPGNDDSIRSLTLIANALGGTITEAFDTYTKAKAAEDKRRKEKEAAEKAVADKARAERKAKEDEEKKKRAKVLEKMKAEKAKAEKEKKKAADKEAFKVKAAAEETAKKAKAEAKAEAKEEAPASDKASTSAKATADKTADKPVEEKAAEKKPAAKPKAKKAPAKKEDVSSEASAKEEVPAEEPKVEKAPVAKKAATKKAPVAKEAPAEEVVAEEAPVAEEAAEEKKED
jgi:small subunit ribosomal protein S2